MIHFFTDIQGEVPWGSSEHVFLRRDSEDGGYWNQLHLPTLRLVFGIYCHLSSPSPLFILTPPAALLAPACGLRCAISYSSSPSFIIASRFQVKTLICPQRSKHRCVSFSFLCSPLFLHDLFISGPCGEFLVARQEEPGRLQSMGSLRVGHDWATSLSLCIFMHWRRKWQPTPVFLPGESLGWGSLLGCHLWGHTELDMTEVT